MRAIFVSFGRNHLGMKPIQRGRTEMEREQFLIQFEVLVCSVR